MRPMEVGVALYLVVCFGDRLRQISWWSVKPIFVTLYLSYMLWALSLLYDAVSGVFWLHQAAGSVAMMVLLQITRPNWSDGIPESFRVGQAHTRQPDL